MTKPVRPNLLAHLKILRNANNFEWLLDHLHATYGPVVDVGHGPYRYTYVFGPEANRFVLSDGAAHFTWKEAFSLTEFIVGPTAILVSDGDDHARRRRLVQPAFARRRVDAQLEHTVAEIDATLAGWSAGHTVDAYDDLRAAVRRIAVRAIFGEDFAQQADAFGQALEPALAYLARSPVQRRDSNLPFTAYRRAVQARIATDRLIMDEVRRRRDNPVETPGFDTLSSLLATADGDDAPLTDAELCDQIRGLIAAGYDTTSSAAAWLVHQLGTNGDVLQRLRKEVQDQLGDRPPSIEDLRAMPLVDGVVRETLRLKPPAAVGLRKLEDDVQIAGADIAAGTMVVYSPYVTHRLPEVWDRPEEFVPERWADGEPQPFSYVPFGGGYRKCLGFALATLELQVLAVRLAQNVSWAVDTPNVRAAGAANMAPKGGLPITITWQA